MKLICPLGTILTSQDFEAWWRARAPNSSEVDTVGYCEKECYRARRDGFCILLPARDLDHMYAKDPRGKRTFYGSLDGARAALLELVL